MAENPVRKSGPLRSIRDILCPVAGSWQVDPQEPQDGVLPVAKLRLGDLDKQERQRAKSTDAAARGKMTGGDAVEIHKQRVAGDASLKPRTKEYEGQRPVALLKSWPGLKEKLIRDVTKIDCLNWATKYGAPASPSAFNHTQATLRALLEIGCEVGARYDNPARFIKRASERPKQLGLPTLEQFERFVTEIENGGGGFSQSCADLVRFLAFGGFRKSEAANICWGDVDMEKGEILVRGDDHVPGAEWAFGEELAVKKEDEPTRGRRRVAREVVRAELNCGNVGNHWKQINFAEAGV